MKFNIDEFNPLTVKMRFKNPNGNDRSNSFKIGIYDYCYYNSS